MKKVLLTFVLLITLVVNASAQFKPFQFGLKIEPGIAWSKLNSDHLNNGKTKINFNWGFVGNIYFVENYGISTGFNIKLMNHEYSFVENGQSVTRKIKNQYFEVPLGLTMRTEKISNIRILGNVSYGMGFLLNTNERNYDSNDAEISMIPEYKKIRHALIVKLGVEYYVHKSSCITAALSFNNNFSNIYDSDYEQNVLLNNLCLEIGFMF